MIVNTLWGPEEIEDETRQCNYCLRKLPLSMFAKDASCKRTQCKDCGREASKNRKESKRLYGNPQTPPIGTPCEVCGSISTKLVYEHNHKTLGFRGWVCVGCNRAMGVLERNIGTTDLNVVATKLMEYVEKSKCMNLKNI